MIPIDMWTFLTIIVVASLLIGAFSEYQKNKLKQQKIQSENRDNVKDLETQLASLRKRIENLEVIAASDSESFADRRKSIILDDLEADEDESDSEHQRLVNELAKKKRQKS
jgi:TolA-binding protein